MNITITIEEEIKIETTFEHIKGLFENDINPNIIAKSFKLSTQKVEEIIQKIKSSENQFSEDLIIKKSPFCICKMGFSN